MFQKRAVEQRAHHEPTPPSHPGRPQKGWVQVQGVGVEVEHDGLEAGDRRNRNHEPQQGPAEEGVEVGFKADVGMGVGVGVGMEAVIVPVEVSID